MLIRPVYMMPGLAYNSPVYIMPVLALTSPVYMMPGLGLASPLYMIAGLALANPLYKIPGLALASPLYVMPELNLASRQRRSLIYTQTVFQRTDCVVRSSFQNLKLPHTVLRVFKQGCFNRNFSFPPAFHEKRFQLNNAPLLGG
jgi:hypothetical protein